MKREAFNHTKLKRLCRRLDLPHYAAVGLLESIWHLTAREAPRGDIGKLSNEDIALAIDFPGDEDRMIEGLIHCGWIDRHPAHRLVIHDWAEHADDAIHMKLARMCGYFVGNITPKLYNLPSKQRETAESFYKSSPSVIVSTHTAAPQTSQEAPPRSPKSQVCSLPPQPEPEPEPLIHVKREAHTHLRKHRNGDEPSLRAPSPSRFSDWLKPWPRVGDATAAARAWEKTVTTREAELGAFAARDRYLASDEVSRNVIMAPAKFLREQARTAWAGKWPAASAKEEKGFVADVAKVFKQRIEKGKSPW